MASVLRGDNDRSHARPGLQIRARGIRGIRLCPHRLGHVSIASSPGDVPVVIL